jgi:hypothetical protein
MSAVNAKVALMLLSARSVVARKWAESIASEEPMSSAIKKGTYNVVRQFHLGRLDPEKLKMIADALGISDAERDRIISAEIVIGPPPMPPGGTTPPTQPPGGAPPSPPSGSARPSPSRRRRRQTQ